MIRFGFDYKGLHTASYQHAMPDSGGQVSAASAASTQRWPLLKVERSESRNLCDSGKMRLISSIAIEVRLRLYTEECLFTGVDVYNTMNYPARRI